MDLFELVGNIVIKNKEANQALDETSQKGEKTQGKLGKAFSTMGKGAVVAGKAIMTGLAAGGAAMAGLTIKALNLSGELEQNMGGSEQVFKEYAGKMQETARNAFSNMGLSTSDFLATANKMGALFQGAGFSIQESSGLASDAMQRAADVASIMGIDTSAAMEAIAGAAKGNFTMMDNLGVAMNDTAIGAYALSKGIDKATKDMTQQEKIGLAMEMFMEKTAYAAGNYARENETLAGSLGTAKAALTNFLDGSGSVDQLVGAFSNAANVIVSNVKDIAPRLISGITDIANQVIPMLPPLLQSLLPPIIDGAVSLIGGLASALPSILDILVNSAIPQLLTGISTVFNSLVSALPGLVQSLVSALPTLIPMLVSAVVDMILALCTNLPSIIQPIIDSLPSIIESINEAVMTNLPMLVEGLVSLIVAVVQMAPQIMTSLISAIPGIISTVVSALIACTPTLLMGVLQLLWEVIKQLPMSLTGHYQVLVAALVGLLSGLWDGLVNLFAPLAPWFNDNVIQPVIGFFQGLWEGMKSVWDGICNVVSFAFELIGSIVSAAFQIITLPFQFIWENCKQYVFDAFEWIKGKIDEAIKFLQPLIQAGFTFIKDNIITPILEAKDKAVDAFNKIKEKVQEKISDVKDKVYKIFGDIKTKISDTVTSIKDKVTDIFDKVKDAMEKPIQTAKDTISGIVDKIKGFFSGMKLEFPNIKLPHFSVSPSGWKATDLLKGTIPKLSIKWYADAMDNPMIMNRPTIFGYNPATGSLLGGGEAGSEVVSGTGTLMNMIQAAVATQNGGMVQILERIVDLLIQFFPDALDAMRTPMVCDTNGLAIAMAPQINTQLGKIAIQKGRGR